MSLQSSRLRVGTTSQWGSVHGLRTLFSRADMPHSFKVILADRLSACVPADLVHVALLHIACNCMQQARTQGWFEGFERTPPPPPPSLAVEVHQRAAL